MTTFWVSIVDRLPSDRRRLVGQILRYAIVGFGVTLAQAAIYWALATLAAVHSQVANFAGYIAAVTLGYVFHGRYTFADPAPVAENGMGHIWRSTKFILASLVSLGLNALWVWLCVSWMQWPTWSPIPAMLFVTPALVFVLNRQWVFRVSGN